MSHPRKNIEEIFIKVNPPEDQR